LGYLLDLHAAKLDERTRERLHRLVLPDNEIFLGDRKRWGTSDKLVAEWGIIAGPASTLLAIHDQFREASRRIVSLVNRESPDVEWVRRAFRPLAITLHHHHHAEEEMLFPMVLERTGTAPEHLAREEALVIPVLLEMPAREAWALLHG
jgi:hypothetical protein